MKLLIGVTHQIVWSDDGESQVLFMSLFSFVEAMLLL